MKKRPWLLVVMMATLAVDSACGTKPWPPEHPPSNVPQDATFIQIPKGCLWQSCRYDPVGDVDRCTIFNASGVAVYSGVYAPYDGGPAANSDDLMIVDGPVENLIFLSNGRVLLLRDDFDHQKQFVDENRHFWKEHIVGPGEWRRP